jgi:membrane dipeptidase
VTDLAPLVPVFDGHNDTLLSLPLTGRSFFERSDEGHVDLPRARAGGLAGGMFAVFVSDPTPAGMDDAPDPDDLDANPSDAAASLGAPRSRYAAAETMPEPMPLEYAQRQALATIARLLRLERASDGQAKVCRTAADVRACMEGGVLAMELHMEGAEAIDPDLDALDVFHAAGLRSLGICWSRPNRFGTGVPFAFPSTGDHGPGLSVLGIALVRACNELRVLIDLSHLNEAGFWDVAKHSQAPLVATHSNVHALCPSARNLSERQLHAIRDSDGLVGLNFHVGFLHADGSRSRDLDLGVMLDHLDALLDALGPTRVGLGSDFDGATMPAAIGDAAGLPALIAAMRGRGYGEDLIRAIARDNWLRVLELTWGA